VEPFHSLLKKVKETTMMEKRTLLAVVTAILVLPALASAGTILFVSSDTEADEVDSTFMTYLTDLGHDVSYSQSTPIRDGNVTGNMINGTAYDAVVASAAFSSGSLSGALTPYTGGVLTWETYICDDMNMIDGGAVNNAEIASMDFTGLGGPVATAAGLSGSVQIFTDAEQSGQTAPTGTENDNLAPGAMLESVAGSNIGIASFEVGAELMDGSAAAGRRVMMPGPNSTFDPNTALTDDGRALLDAAVNWAVVPEPMTLSLLGLGGLALLRRRR
jgi:hypothetical protein